MYRSRSAHLCTPRLFLLLIVVLYKSWIIRQPLNERLSPEHVSIFMYISSIICNYCVCLQFIGRMDLWKPKSVFPVSRHVFYITDKFYMNFFQLSVYSSIMHFRWIVFMRIQRGDPAPLQDPLSNIAAGGRARTDTVSPPRDFKSRASAYSATPAMGGGGFEPPKHKAADLQSVPFGRSGNHPTWSIFLRQNGIIS